MYPLLSAEKDLKRRKRSSSIRHIYENSPSTASPLSSEERQVGKSQKLSPRKPSPSKTKTDELEQNTAPITLDQAGAPAQSPPESFTLPEGFLDGVLPDSDLQNSDSFLADLNLDHYFTYGFSTADLTPEGQDFGK